MIERGILFSAPMVRAILAGRKTQTRRLAGLDQVNEQPDRWGLEQDGLIDLPGAPFNVRRGALFRDAAGERVFVPAVYTPDTLLWVREAFRLPVTLDEMRGSDIALRMAIAGEDLTKLPVHYEADDGRRHWNGDFQPGRYRHARFMSRWAARIDCVYVGERVERLQQCSEADAIAEGLLPAGEGFRGGPDLPWFASPIAPYHSLWDSINGDGNWEANPWVRVVSFRSNAP